MLVIQFETARKTLIEETDGGSKLQAPLLVLLLMFLVLLLVLLFGVLPLLLFVLILLWLFHNFMGTPPRDKPGSI